MGEGTGVYIRPTAMWIISKDDDWAGGEKTTCTNCHTGYASGAYHEPWEFKFCPTCGCCMTARRYEAGTEHHIKQKIGGAI